MVGAMMNAAHVPAFGPAGSIRVGQVRVPRVGPTDVLVAVEAVVVNPVDTYIRSGQFPTTVPMPFVVGRDLVGTVFEAGPAAVPFGPGEKVWCNSLGYDGRQGSFAEYAVVPAERLYRLPAGVDPETAVAVAHPAATAYLGWFVHARLEPRETVYVGGGAGNVGRAAIQMATLAGARVLASARPEDHAACRAAGADVVLDYRDPQLFQRLIGAAPAGVEVFWDTSGTNDLDLAVRATAAGGRILITAATSEMSRVRLPLLYTHDIALLGFVISRAGTVHLAAAASLINQMLADNRLTARIADRLPLAQTAAAHELIESSRVSGRLLLYPGPSIGHERSPDVPASGRHAGDHGLSGEDGRGPEAPDQQVDAQGELPDDLRSGQDEQGGRRVVPAPEKHPDASDQREWTADEPEQGHRPGDKPGAPHEITEQDPVPEAGAELRPEEECLVMERDQRLPDIDERRVGAVRT
ncbi:MAG TPA: zinc-binding dehydrogenase [Nocardioidaceae bacterium]|nr:zinc-binding dehydrogenase [Nocardioidaceae bacterium]